jgi:hypothetical protein
VNTSQRSLWYTDIGAEFVTARQLIRRVKQASRRKFLAEEKVRVLAVLKQNFRR